MTSCARAHLENRPQKSVYTDRLVRLMKSLASHLCCDDEAQVNQMESIVFYNLDKGLDVSKTVRIRVGLLLHSILADLPVGTALSEEIFESLETYALGRLADKEVEVRIHAARCSKRLPEPNEVRAACQEVCTDVQPTQNLCPAAGRRVLRLGDSHRACPGGKL